MTILSATNQLARLPIFFGFGKSAHKALDEHTPTPVSPHPEPDVPPSPPAPRIKFGHSHGSFPIEHFPSPPTDTYSDDALTVQFSPSPPPPDPSTSTSTFALLPTYTTLVANRQALLATLSAAKTEAIAALADVCIAQAELDTEVEGVQELVQEIAKIAGWDFVKGVIMEAQAAAAEQDGEDDEGTGDEGNVGGGDGSSEGSSDGESEQRSQSTGGKDEGSGSSSSSSPSSGDDHPSPAKFQAKNTTGRKQFNTTTKANTPTTQPKQPIAPQPQQPPSSRKHHRSHSPHPQSSSLSSVPSSSPSSDRTSDALDPPRATKRARRDAPPGPPQPTATAATAPTRTHADASVSAHRPLPLNPLKRRREPGPDPDQNQRQDSDQAHSEASDIDSGSGAGEAAIAGRALVLYPRSKRRRLDREGDRECRAEVVQEGEASGFVRRAVVEGADGKGKGKGEWEGESDGECDSSYVTSGSDNGSRFSSSSGSSFPSDHGEDDDDDDLGGDDYNPTSPYTLHHPASPPTSRGGSFSGADALTGTSFGFENGGSNALAVDPIDESNGRIRGTLAFGSGDRNSLSQDYDSDSEEQDSPSQESQARPEADPSRPLAHERGRTSGAGAEEAFRPDQESQPEAGPSRSCRPLARDCAARPNEEPHPSRLRSQAQAQSQPEAGPSRRRRPLRRERAIAFAPDVGPSPQPQAGPSHPRSVADVRRALTRERERIRETSSGDLEVYLPEEEPEYAQRLANEAAVIEEWANYEDEDGDGQAYPYGEDLLVIKAEAGWMRNRW